MAVTPAGAGQQTARLTAWDAQAGDGFGWSVALGDQMALVGAPTRGINPGPGAAYLYDTLSGAPLFTLAASDTTAGDGFGASVAVSHNTALIGATFGGSDHSTLAGAAYLYDVNTGNEMFKLSPNDSEALDGFGTSVAIGPVVAVIGAPADNTAAGVDAGSAYVFDPTTGEQWLKLTASDASAGAAFGASVAIDNNTALIGAYRDSGSADGAGAAYIFDAYTGTQTRKLTASDAAAGAHFGWSVAVTDTFAVVGAPTGDAQTGPGAAYVFDLTTGEELFKLTASDGTVGDRFGTSVAIGQGAVIVGATLGSADSDSLAGAAYVFNLATGQEVAKLTADGSQAIDYFGGAVTIYGQTVAVGAHGQNTAQGVDAGSAYLFNLAVSIPGDLNGDGFVGVSDLNIIFSHWNLAVTPGDLLLGDVDGDGFVGIEDLTFILSAWNTGSPPTGTASLPEPVSAGALGLLCAFFVQSRRC
ncbi:MAG: hypothetical protein R3C45_05435 [Phycisphaerales bacterium]